MPLKSLLKKRFFILWCLCLCARSAVTPSQKPDLNGELEIDKDEAIDQQSTTEDIGKKLVDRYIQDQQVAQDETFQNYKIKLKLLDMMK